MPDKDWFRRTYPQFTDEYANDRWEDKHDNVRFCYYGDVLDEIFAQNVNIHFECMDTGSWWMVVQTPDGRDFHVNVGVKRKKSAGDRRDDVWTEKHLENWGFHEEDSEVIGD